MHNPDQETAMSREQKAHH